MASGLRTADELARSPEDQRDEGSSSRKRSRYRFRVREALLSFAMLSLRQGLEVALKYSSTPDRFRRMLTNVAARSSSGRWRSGEISHAGKNSNRIPGLYFGRKPGVRRGPRGFAGRPARACNLRRECR